MSSEAFGGGLAFVAAEIVENDHVTLAKGGGKLGLDIGVDGPYSWDCRWSKERSGPKAASQR